MREQAVEQGTGQFRDLVVDLLPQPPGEEGEALQQPLHRRVGHRLGQERRRFRLPRRQLPAQLA